MSAKAKQLKQLEMGYTPPECRRTLQGQFIQNTIYSCKEISNTQWEISISNKAFVAIKISEAPARKIAMLTLPVLNTRFEFNFMSTEEQKNFMNIFFRYFHKGGG